MHGLVAHVASFGDETPSSLVMLEVGVSKKTEKPIKPRKLEKK
jgi:hypothetical protein